MITVLVAEDELATREGMMRQIPWKSIGADIVEAASDGLAAVNLCESLHPDILLTDVRMPKMDGIQLASYVRERYPDCRIIFVSGFTDKEYLKSAIHLGAVSYVEKPIDLKEIEAILSRTIRACLEDFKKKGEIALLDSLVSQSKPLIVQKLAIAATYSRPDETFLHSLFHTCALIKDRSYCIRTAMVKLYETASLSDGEYEYYISEILAFFQSEISEEAGLLCALAGFSDRSRLIVHCISDATLPNAQQKEDIRSRLDNLFRKYAGIFEFSAVVGHMVPSVYQIADSHKTALSMMKNLFFKQKGMILFYEELQPAPMRFLFNETEYNTFQQLLQNESSQAVFKFLDALADTVSRSEDTDIGYVKNIYFKLFLLLSDTTGKKNIKVELLEAEGSYIWKQLSNMDTVYDINAYLHTLISTYYSMLENKSGAERSISDILRYIDEHCCEQSLSIKSIAEYSHYDHYYLCTLFKKHTGRTLNDYITQTRIEKALEFLKDKNIKLYEITGMVGYSDPSYFSHLFKKHVGSTPSEYRGKYIR
jgi:two-component system, response regulator YesN